MKPFVSILIPAYNAETWIADAIRSAIDQTWHRREIIVVDDGSTDRTLQVAGQFASEGVRVVTQPNQGASAARNTAFSLSQGDYIQWLDADDLLAPDKIARQVHALESCASKRTLLSCPWAHFFYRTRRAKFRPSPLWRDLSPVEWLLIKMGQNQYMQPATWLVSREVTEAAGPWDTRLWRDNDGEYFCRVILASDGIRFVPEGQVFYRRSGFRSVTHIGRSGKKLESLFVSMQLHVDYLRSLEDSERVRAASVQYLQNWLGNFSADRPDIVERLQQMAAALGGRLSPPAVSWKYRPFRSTLGPTAAHRIQSYAPMLKESVKRSWDRTLYRLEESGRDYAGQLGRLPQPANVRWASVSKRSLRLSSFVAALFKAGEQFWT